MEFHEHLFDNGLRVIGEHNPNAQSFAAGYFVMTGARDESDEISGVSHFLEHMMFKGTAHRSADDINREFDQLGASYNAFTSDERTVYYGAVLPENGLALLDLLTDMMRPMLRQADFDIEKKVILEEIAMYQDRPSSRLFDIANERYFNGHPLGKSILGSSDSITALTSEQMRQYFKQRYVPNNLLLSLAGNYQWEQVLNQVEQASADWQTQDVTRSYPKLNALQGFETRQDAKIKRVHLMAYAPGIAMQDERQYAAAIAASCIGGGEGSRLYWALTDKGLVDSASLSHEAADGLGIFTAYISTSVDQLASVRDILITTLQDVQTHGLTQEEWLRAQRRFATSMTLRAEAPFGRLMSLGTTYQYQHIYRTLHEGVQKVMDMTLDQGHDLLAQKPFDALYGLVLHP